MSFIWPTARFPRNRTEICRLISLISSCTCMFSRTRGTFQWFRLGLIYGDLEARIMPHKKPFQTSTGSSASSSKTPDSSSFEHGTYIRNLEPGYTALTIWIKPGARQNAITGLTADGLGVQVNAPPREGRANDELIEYLADVLNMKRSQLSLISGHRSRQKTVQVFSLTQNAGDIHKLVQSALENS